MRKLLRYLTAILFLLAVGGVSSYADTYTWTLAKEDNLNSSTSASVGTPMAIAWTASAKAAQWQGNQNGFEWRNVSDMTLSTSGITGTISSIKITGMLFGKNATGNITSVTVGGNKYTYNSNESATLTTSSTEYEFKGNASGEIVLTFNGRFILKSIVIEYSSGPITYTYEKVTDAKQLRAGNKYLIVYENGTSSKALATKDGSGNYGSSADVTVADSKITTATDADDSPYEVTLGGTEGAWTLTVDGQLLGNRVGAYLFYGDANAETTWVITPSTASTTIQNATNTSYFLQYNNSGSNDIFSCYGSNAVNAVSMYVLSGSSERSEATITIPSSVTVGGTAKITYDDGISPTFTSSDETVATVDASGLITGVATGTTTITATWPGTGTILGGSAKQAIEVKEKTRSNPTITIKETSVAVGGTTTITYPEELTDIAFTSSNANVKIGTSSDGSATVTVLSSATADETADITATWSQTDNYNAGIGCVVGTITVKAASTTGKDIIFSNDYSSWDNYPNKYSTSKSVTSVASDKNSYSFTATQVIKQQTWLQLKKSAGKLVSPTFDFDYTVTVTYSSAKAITLTDGTSTKTGSATSGTTSSSNTTTVSLDVASGTAFTFSVGSEYCIITNITITPKNGGSATTDVTPPTIGDQSDDHKVTITIPEGTTVYYTNDGSSPLSSDGKSLSGSVRQYSSGDVITLTKATTIKAVAMDANGNFSSVASKNFTYNGEVAIPYYEEFLTELGNFTVESTATSTSYKSPVWETHSNESSSKWGARQYAWAQGLDEDFNALVGYTFLISPIIDLTDGGTNDFTDAYFYFEHKAGHFVSDSLKIQCTVWIRDVSDGTPGGWKQIDPSSISWPTSVTGRTFALTNSGNISLKDYLKKKIQISFRYSHTRTNTTSTGTWNVDYIYVNATKPGESETTEAVTTNGGLVTYVTKRKVNWAATRNNNKSANTDDNGNLIYNVRGFKVTEFDANTVVLVEFGTGAIGSEQYTPQNTPIVLKGATDDQSKHEVYLTVYNTDETIAPPEGNLLRASYNDVTAKDGERLFVMQKISGTYGWHKLKTGRTVPDRKAYLNGVDEKTKVSVTESDPLNGKYVSFDDLDNSGTSTGISSISGETNKGRHDNTFYNLQGMKVENPSHGIYIYNGRKIIIK